MKTINEVRLLGALGGDPEKKVHGETTVVHFSLATNTKKGGKEVPQWHNIVAFNKLGELCAEHLEKGKRVMVSGSLNPKQWEADDGTKRYKTEIVAEDVVFL